MNLEFPGVRLEAELAEPARPNGPITILAHPHPVMGGDMHNKVIDQLFRRSVERGWGALRYNSRGVGQSTGTYDHGNDETEDCLRVLGWAETHFNVGADRIMLLGYSFGSWICSRAAARLPTIKKLILIAPPVTSMDFSPLVGVKHRKQVFAAERDEISSLEAVREWFDRLEQPKTIQVIPKADHFFIGQTTELIRSVLRAIEE